MAIIGSQIEPLLEFEAVATAIARCTVGDESLTIVRSVLPWPAATAQAPDIAVGIDFADMFSNAVAAHAALIRHLQRRGDSVVWAGNFNQSLAG